MTLLLELRERAKGSYHHKWADTARRLADALEHAVKTFSNNPTDENMTGLNGLWAMAHRVLKEYPPEPEVNPPTQLRQELRKAA